MTRVDVDELRGQPRRYLDLVKRGESVEITEHDQLVALLVPPRAAMSARERLIAEGRLIPATAPRGSRPKRAPLPPGTPSVSELLDGIREDRI